MTERAPGDLPFDGRSEARFKQLISRWGQAEPGDMITEAGPRIGWRYWLIVDVVEKRKWAVLHCTRLRTVAEVAACCDEIRANGGHFWDVGDHTAP